MNKKHYVGLVVVVIGFFSQSFASTSEFNIAGSSGPFSGMWNGVEEVSWDITPIYYSSYGTPYWHSYHDKFNDPGIIDMSQSNIQKTIGSSASAIDVQIIFDSITMDFMKNSYFNPTYWDPKDSYSYKVITGASPNNLIFEDDGVHVSIDLNTKSGSLYFIDANGNYNGVTFGPVAAPAPVPVPSTMLLLGSSLAVLTAVVRKKRNYFFS